LKAVSYKCAHFRRKLAEQVKRPDAFQCHFKLWLHTNKSGGSRRRSYQQRDADGHTWRQHVHHCQRRCPSSSDTASYTPQDFR